MRCGTEWTIPSGNFLSCAILAENDPREHSLEDFLQIAIAAVSSGAVTSPSGEYAL